MRDADKEIDRAMYLIGEGELSRGTHLLTSKGLADLADDRVTQQLAAKHPARKEPLPDSWMRMVSSPDYMLSCPPQFENWPVMLVLESAGSGMNT